MATRRLLTLAVQINTNHSTMLRNAPVLVANMRFASSQQERWYAAGTPSANSTNAQSKSQVRKQQEATLSKSDPKQKHIKGENGGSSNKFGGEEAGSATADGSYRTGALQKGRDDVNTKGSSKGGFDQSGGDKSQSPSTRGSTPVDDLSTAGPKSSKTSSSSMNKQPLDHADVAQPESVGGGGKRGSR